jgi:hypothetical protein
MEDAERMIRLFPEHAKSYYRKGEILTAMKVSMLQSSRTRSWGAPPPPRARVIFQAENIIIIYIKKL